MSALSINTVPTMAGNYNIELRPQKMKLGKRFISMDLKPTLERFILSSTNSNDRTKALDMLTYMEDCNKQHRYDSGIVTEYKLKKDLRRPKTAYAKFYGSPSLQRFSTTYNEYYPMRELKETTATRPSSTENIIIRPNNVDECAVELKDNIDISYDISAEEPQKILSVYNQQTTYTKDYCSTENTEHVKLNQKNRCSPTRAATASGSRCHNPHPNQAFLVWRYPRETHNKGSRVPSETILKANMDNKFAHITDEQFGRVLRGNCRSTYQSDFVGGSYPDSRLTPFYIHPQVKLGEKLKISTQRIDYSRPQSLPSELSVPHDRYKSNKTKNESAIGIIPEATNKVYMNTTVRTTYDEDINDRAEVIHGQIVNDIQRKVDLSKLHNMQALKKAMLEAKNIEDKETLGRIFQRLSEPDDYKRTSFVRKPYYNSDRPCWTSNWPGPL